MADDLQIEIFGEPITLRFVNRLGKKGKGDDGDCQPPGTENRTIRIRRGQKPQAELDTILHELMHAADWHKDEDSWVAHLAEVIADTLWKLGYRKQ